MNKLILAAAALATVIGLTACEVPEDSATGSNNQSTQTKQDKQKAQAKPKRAETVSQENARESAESYLAMSAFSRSGLIDQLKFEGYSIKDATYGVDSQKANWSKQAAESAANYLDMSSFSRSGLIEQLEFEGYTTRQATYGVTQAGL